MTVQQTRNLCGRNVAAIGLGCMSFGGIFGSTTEEDSLACLDAAFEAGIDHLDVAEVYGNGVSESVIGKWLARTGAEVSIATKAGIYQSKDGGAPFRNDEASLRASLEGSLKRLGVDRVDLFYVHRREQAIPIEDVMGTMLKFMDEGKIGGIGFSEIAPYSLRRAHKVHPVAAIQNEYSLWSRAPELGMVQTCAELGTTLVAFSPLARGMFSKRPLTLEDLPAQDYFRPRNPRFTEPNFSLNSNRIADFRTFCQTRGWSIAGAAIAWVLDQGDHVLPIPGTRVAEHLRDFATGDAIRFTNQDRAEIARLLPVGWAYGDRYSEAQNRPVEHYC